MASIMFKGVMVPLVTDEKDFSLTEYFAAETFCGGNVQGASNGRQMACMVGISVARTIQGVKFPAVLDDLTVGDVAAAVAAIDAEEAALAAATTAHEPGTGGTDGEVLSPTPVASESEPPAA
jgi:hypothetical protein